MRSLMLVGRLCLVVVFIGAPACLSGSNPTPHPGVSESGTNADGTRPGSLGSSGEPEPTDETPSPEPPMGGNAAEDLSDAAAMAGDTVDEDVATDDVGPSEEDVPGD